MKPKLVGFKAQGCSPSQPTAATPTLAPASSKADHVPLIHTHTHTLYRHCWPPEEHHKHKNRHHTHTNSTCINKLYQTSDKWSDLFIRVVWSHAHELLGAGHKLWSPQRLPLKVLTLLLEVGVDISPSTNRLPNPLLSPVSCPQTYRLWLSDLWSHPPATLDWSSLAPHIQRIERTLNQENN